VLGQAHITEYKMGLNHSPSIVTNGLVFTYDMSNTQKSWKGKPITNIILDPTNWTTGNWSRPGCTAVANNAIAPDGTNTASTITSTGSDPYPNQLISVTGGVTYTASVYIQARPQTIGKTGILWLWFAGTATGTNTFSPTYTLTSTWQRITVTFTPTTSGTVYYRNDIVDTGAVAGDACDLWGAQVEIGSFASPFVAGTRTSAAAILNQVRTLNQFAQPVNVVYNSDNTFSFNGLSSVLNLGDLSLASNPNGGIGSTYTVELIFKPTEVINFRNVFDGIGSGNYGPRLEMNSSGNLVWISGNSGGSSASYTVRTSGLEVNQWHHVALTLSSGTFRTYYNGNLVTTATDTFPNDSDRMYGVIVGRGFSTSSERWFKGDIPVTRIYNNALSPSQVLQNFNALKGRYGL
jgi:hypothetical protein